MMRRRSEMPAVPSQPWAQLIAPDSFYARLARWRDVLVDDEDYAPLYKDSPRGRPSIPPSMVVLAMLLQYHDDCSDAEAEQRMRFDLRWKHALGLELEEEGFDSTVLCHFRRKLLDHGLERALFERLVNAAREAGLITKGAAQLIDSSHILGAAGARDTYALIRGGIRKLLRALGYTSTRRAELGERLSWYLEPDVCPRSPSSTGVMSRPVPPTSKRSSKTPGRRSRWESLLSPLPRQPKRLLHAGEDSLRRRRRGTAPCSEAAWPPAQKGERERLSSASGAG
jgi:transposase